MIQDQARTTLYSLNMMLQKLEYLEKVGSLKFDTEESAKDYCSAVLRNGQTWRTGYSLYADDMGQAGVVRESFPHGGDEMECHFWDTGRIIQYALNKDDLQNGEVLSRKDLWKALRAVFERNKALLKWKIDRMIIKKRIREVA